MNQTMAILGSWDPRWIEDHQRWLCSDGAHFDGWKRAVKRETFERLRLQGDFHFYAYLPASKRGCGHIVFRLKCDAPVYTEAGRRCRHEHRRHHDSGARDYRLCFTIRKIEELREHQDVRIFETIAGKRLRSGQSTLAMPFVKDRHFQVKR